MTENEPIRRQIRDIQDGIAHLDSLLTARTAHAEGQSQEILRLRQQLWREQKQTNVADQSLRDYQAIKEANERFLDREHRISEGLRRLLAILKGLSAGVKK